MKRCIFALTLIATLGTAQLAPAVQAQDSAGSYLIQIRSGTCDAPGDGLAQLDDLTFDGSSPVGAAAASAASSSYSVAPIALEALTSSDSAVVILDAANRTMVACGEIGGVIGADGALSIGIRPMNDSGLSGIAYLSPSGGQTGISTFLAATGATGSGGESAAPAAMDSGAYTAMVNSQLTILVGSLQRIDTLFGAANASDTGWVSQVRAELFLWQLLYRVAQEVIPPADLADFDEQYKSALQLLDSAATDISDALKTSDDTKLASASEKIEQAVTTLRGLQTPDDTATPAAATPTS